MALSLATKRDFAGLNSGAAVIAREIQLEKIQTHPTFENLFPIQPSVYNQLKERIEKYGFEKEHPLIIWKETGILLDGHTRRKVLLDLGINFVSVAEVSFSSEEDALEYTIGLQTGRRNLTDSEILTSLAKLDQLKKRGRSSENESKGKSAQHLAEVLGTSRSKIEKSRAINLKALPEIQEAVKSGDLSINAAYKKIKNQSVEKSANILFKKIQKMKLEELADFLSENQYKKLSKDEWILKLQNP